MIFMKLNKIIKKKKNEQQKLRDEMSECSFLPKTTTS